MEKDNSLIGITVRNSLISLSFVLLLINVGGRPVLGTFGYENPYADFIATADFDQLRQEPQITGTVFYLGERNHVRWTGDDPSVHV